MGVDFDALALAPCIAAFGEKANGRSVTYQPAGGAAAAVDGIFDAAHEEVTVQQGAPVSTINPMLGIRLADFPGGTAPAQGDRLTIRGTPYEIVDIEPDGQGGANLKLMLASDDADDS